MSGLGIGSGLSGVMSTSLGAVGAAGAGAVAGVAALSAAVFALGGAAGMGISKVTGLRGVLENFYGSKFFGLDEANERSSNLDAQLAKFQEKDAVRKQSQQQKQLEDAQDKKAYEGASWSYSGKVSDSYLRSVASSDFDKQLEILRARQAEVNAKYVSVQGDDYKAKTERLKLDEEIMDLGGRIADVEKRKLAKSQEEDRELFEAQFNRISNNDTEGDSFKISARQIEMLGQRIEADSAELATLTGDAFESAQKNLEKERDRLAALKASAQREAADFAKEVSDSAFDFDLKNTFRPEEQSKKLQDKIGKSLGSIDISDGLSKKEFGSIKEAQSMASQLQELARSQFRPNVRESKMSDAVEKGSMEDYRLRSMTDTKSDNSEAKKAADAAIGIQRKIGELYERMIGTGIKVQIANAANV